MCVHVKVPVAYRRSHVVHYESRRPAGHKVELVSGMLDERVSSNDEAAAFIKLCELADEDDLLECRV